MKKQADEFKIAELIFRDLQGRLTGEEEDILRKWIALTPENRALYEKIIDEDTILARLKAYDEVNSEKAWEKIDSLISEKNKNRRLHISHFMKYAAAVLIPALLITYIYVRKHGYDRQNQVAHTVEILPGTQRAILTLSDGKQIELNVSGQEAVIKENEVNIHNASKTLRYLEDTTQKNEFGEIAYNTLATPKGGEYYLELTDGTKIWLNADSKLRYPTLFAKDERRVFLEGEAYFEVKKNPAKPFIVDAYEMETRVLGTSFNITAYSDDKNMATTLAEGAVKVSIVSNTADESANLVLKPGEQAVLEKESNTFNILKVDTETYTAWKEGKFVIANEELESIMRRLGRWYNFETQFTSPETRYLHFSGTIGRYDTIESILEMISLTTKISFEIKDKVVYVTKN